MAKVNLLNVGSLGNPISAQATINANNTAIEGAFENTLSRDGTAPNNMLAPIDMDGQRILNVGTPIADGDAANVRTLRALIQEFATTAGDLGALTGKVVSVESFGAAGDGVTDDTAAIQAAIDAVQDAGGGVVKFLSTSYNVTGTLLVTASNVMLQGTGEGHQHDAGSGRDAATALVWGGASGGTILKIAPIEGVSARRISGGGIDRIGFYGEDVAARAVELRSVNNLYVNIYGERFTTDVLYMGVVGTLGEAKDNQQNDIRVLFSQVSNATGKGVVLDGDSVANTSCNDIHVRGAYKFATALELKNCDNNIIYLWAFRFGGGTGIGLDSLGGASAAVAARANTFEYIYAGDGGVRLRGTGDGYAVASTRTRFLMWDNDNVQPAPVVGTGCDYFLVDHDGQLRWTECSVARVAPNVLDVRGTTSDKIMLRMQWVGTAADSFVELRNTSAGAVQIRAESGTASDVAMHVLTKGAGTGVLYGGNFASAAFQWRHSGGPQIGFYGASPVSKPTVTGSRGGNAALQSLLTQLATLGLITDSTSA